MEPFSLNNPESESRDLVLRGAFPKSIRGLRYSGVPQDDEMYNSFIDSFKKGKIDYRDQGGKRNQFSSFQEDLIFVATDRKFTGDEITALVGYYADQVRDNYAQL